MSEIFENTVPYFFDNVLSTPAGSLPKGAQWIVVFDGLQTIWPAIESSLKYERQEWRIKAAADVASSPAFQTNKGCVLCQAIGLPGEGLVTNPGSELQFNSYVRPYVGQGREQFPILRMTFLETNASFVDNFLRPWTIASGTYGLIARTDPKEQYRCKMWCYKIGTIHPNRPPFPLMKIEFQDICCVGVSEEEYSYQTVTQPILREAQFVYNSYSIDTDCAKDTGIFASTNITLQ